GGAGAAEGPAPGRRAVTLDDLHAFRDVDDPRISPDGQWVAYTVRTVDAKRDTRDKDVYMTSWDGSRTVRLTARKESEHTPRWSPDGRFLAFLSSRDYDEETDQVWLLDRQGGEAQRLTEFKGGVEDYAWSPDGTRLAVIAGDPDPEAAKNKDDDGEERAPKPIVITRYQFKEDVTGYLTDLRQHLYLFDLATRKAELLTPGPHDDHLPSWSPDGRQIAFVSKRGKEADRTDNFDVYVVEARPGAAARPITTSPDADADPGWGSAPEWSPDGRTLVYLQGAPQKLIYYGVYQLAAIPASGGVPRLLSAALDRNVVQPRFSSDGRFLHFLLEDDRSVHLARIPAAGGPIERVTGAQRVVSAYDLDAKGRIALLSGTATEPAEVQALEAGGSIRPLSRQNEALLAQVALGDYEPFTARSKDGTPVNGLLVKPAGWVPGTRYPAILDIHGGPVAQHQHEFCFDWQYYAARGYAVIAMNPRGSSGRGQAYATAIYAEWGKKDAQDVLAGVDAAVARGIADPHRLAVGGWSYGGILTNYVISQDTRFKAAVSGAGISNILAGYGTDQYIREYENELGTPWSNLKTWLNLSTPFTRADRIVTPTLFMCGEKDFNVPLLNTEQMYQALRSLGRETALVIYPGQYHGITRPSYERDRLERWVAWYDTHAKGVPAAPGPIPRAAPEPPTDQPAGRS
ncbi:MAG: prolyl oligopeptidase family serine peptidase, partial [Candidatus Polarisedimenticolia bacterium]